MSIFGYVCCFFFTTYCGDVSFKLKYFATILTIITIYYNFIISNNYYHNRHYRNFQGATVLVTTTLINYRQYTINLPELLDLMRSFPIEGREISLVKERYQKRLLYVIGVLLSVNIFVHFIMIFIPYSEEEVSLVTYNCHFKLNVCGRP